MASEHRTADDGSSHFHGYSEISPEDPGVQSGDPSRPPSSGGDRQLQKKSRVRFNSTSEANDGTNRRSNIPALDDLDFLDAGGSISKEIKLGPSHSRTNSGTSLLKRTPESEEANPFADPAGTSSPINKPRPSIVKSTPSYDLDEDVGDSEEKAFSALAAQERAQRVATLVGSHSAPASRRNSFEEDEDAIGFPRAVTRGYPVRLDDIPLMDMDSKRTYDGAGLDSDEEDLERQGLQPGRPKQSSSSEAHKLVRAHTRTTRSKELRIPAEPASGLVSGQVTPTEEQTYSEEYVPRPEKYRGGILSSLLKLYHPPHGHGHSNGNSSHASGGSSNSPSAPGSVGSSGATTPRTKHQKWYKHKNQSQDTLLGLIEASNMLSAHGTQAAAQNRQMPPKKASRTPPNGKRLSNVNLIGSAYHKITKPTLEDEIRITVHIAETLSRQKYLLKLCRALMAYGAPTHRLEEYMKMSARVLEIDGQFLYMPGCMIISFDDASTHTTEVKLVRSAQGVDLGKLKDIHEIYKEVVHDVIGVEEATQRLDVIITNKQKNHAWALVFVYGLASASVAPFAFEGRLVDLPVAFFLGSLLGFLQLIVAPRSDLYSNVFEISAAVLTSFLARAFGSIRGGNLFCFSALAQSAIALILPGYMVLCGSLELQSRSMVAGSVRMVYAIIYSLFLGFGITIGTVLYGLIDPNATSATTCSNPLSSYWKWPFVPALTLCLCIINQAKWKQMPVMIVIAFAGYVVNFFSAQKFPSSAQISSTFGALAVGVLGNLYSRVRHGVAAAALLPAIFVQVPSGLAASGSLLAGLSSADQITNSTQNANGTALNGTSIVPVTASTDLNAIVFNVGFSMIQVAIGITVGLFLSALIVYPLGKRRSGLFSF